MAKKKSKINNTNTSNKNINLERAFTIVLISIFGFCMIPLLNLTYLGWLLFLPAVGFSIFNFINSKETNRRKFNLAIMVLAILGIIPFIGYVSRAVALGLSIRNLTKF